MWGGNLSGSEDCDKGVLVALGIVGEGVLGAKVGLWGGNFKGFWDCREGELRFYRASGDWGRGNFRGSGDFGDGDLVEIGREI